MESILDPMIENLSNIIEKETYPKVLVFNDNILPIYSETKDLIFLVSKKLGNIFCASKSKCFIKKTSNDIPYYFLLASEEDKYINKVPLRPVGCPKNMKDPNISKLAANEVIKSLN